MITTSADPVVLVALVAALLFLGIVLVRRMLALRGAGSSPGQRFWINTGVAVWLMGVVLLFLLLFEN